MVLRSSTNTGSTPLRLLGGAGGKKAYIPVSELNPEQLAERRADELRRKQAQRARKKGETPIQFKENIAGRSKARVVEKEKKITDRETRAEERRLFREGLPADKKRWKKSLWNKKSSNPDLAIQGVGTSIKRNRNKLRTQLKKNLKAFSKIANSDDWEKAAEDFRKSKRGSPVLRLQAKSIENIHNGALRRWFIEGGLPHRNPFVFLDLCMRLVERVIRGVKSVMRKVSLEIDIQLRKPNPEGGKDLVIDRSIHSGIHEIQQDSDLDSLYLRMKTALLENVDNVRLEGSGWIIDEINGLYVTVDSGNPIAGSSHIELPEWIAVKKAVLNLKNSGDDCFSLSVAASLLLLGNPKLKNLERVPKILRKKAESLEMGDIKMPMTTSKIHKFEKQNPTLSVTMHGIRWGKEEIEHIFQSRNRKGEEGKKRKNVNLLWWENEFGQGHYAPITRLSALLFGQVSKCEHRSESCSNCYEGFPGPEELNVHIENGLCYQNDPQQCVYPDKTIKFEGHRNSQWIPFIFISDTEAYNIPPTAGELGKSKNTVKLTRQVPSGLGLMIVGPPGYKNSYKKFDTVDEYAAYVVEKACEIHSEWFLNPIPLTMTQEDERKFKKSKKCDQCEVGFKYLISIGRQKVQDHDHFTGRFRGAACSYYNLKMKAPGYIPIYFHNLGGYDIRHIIRGISKKGRVECIPRTKENFITVRIPLDPLDKKSKTFSLKFTDSLKLMGGSLDSLVKTLEKGDLKISREMFSDLSDEDFNLLMGRKGVFPYDWFTGLEKLKQKFPPPIEDFHSMLYEEPCSAEDYEHFKILWRISGSKDMQALHDLYLKSDVCQLADIIQKFREENYGVFSLDPAWYITTPSFARDVMLKITKIKLDTVGDADMHLFLEEPIRGGNVMAVKRYSEANHKYMKSYDPSKPSVFIMMYDVNNLYGAAMCGVLPDGGLQWMEEWELEMWEDLMGHEVGEDTGMGCFMRVDLVYPDALHDLHSDFPMACERMKLGNVEKLVCNLHDKTDYILHHDELRYYLSQGMILKKIHSGIKFTQSRWLAPYIKLNTRLRAEATTEYKKNIHKLLVNAGYGKFIENKRNRITVKLLRETGKIEKLVSRQSYKDRTAYPDYPGEKDPLVAMMMGKKKVIMDKTPHVGAAILSAAKVMMYEFFYGYAKPKWGDNIRLLYTDTDSLCVEIHTDDVYADTAADVETHFDTSNIPLDHPAVLGCGFPAGKNKKVLGMMKDESAGRNITKGTFLCAKSYAIQMEGDEGVEKVWVEMEESGDTEGERPKRDGYVKGKGVKGYVTKKTRFDELNECRLTGIPVYKSQNTLRNYGQKIFMERSDKKAFCAEDSKRRIMPNKIDTLPWGHYSLRE